ncbi:hypothetical protein Lepto7375DRAFT_2335 [Leptolyngbya sp. PCC 7375]|nr:hypothetical protein Lepto7375DRAFT_2335 [Leptolyngbya sp. PCC 7375]
MDTLTVFGLQFVFSLVVYALLVKWYLMPWLAKKPVNQALIPLIIPHAFRYLGLAFLVPQLVAQPLPGSFANAAAYGDFMSGLLALFSLLALRASWRFSLPLVWLFNIVGAGDLINALHQAEVVPYFGTTWYIPTFVVPLLLVTHGLIFVRLFKELRPTLNSQTGETAEV